MRQLFCRIVLLMLVLPISLWAQDKKKFTISGYIEDAETGERILGANIFDPKSGLGTSSNIYGFYSLTLPEDSVYLSASYIGLQTQYFKLYLNQDVSMDIKLTPTVELQTVEVVATDVEEKIEERNQMSQISIPIEQIKALPAFLGEVDVLKIIQLLPGVQSGEGNSGLYVRGGSPDQNLILLDGVPVYNVYHLFGFFSVFNADAIKSVQLTKGGYPARFGGRLSSVLEINMKEGNLKKLRGEGSIGLISSKFTIEAPIWKDKTSFIFSARRTYIDVLAKPFIILAQKAQGDAVAVPGYYFYDVNAKINHIFDKKNRLYLSFYAGDDKFNLKYTDKQMLTNGTETFTLNTKIQWGNVTSALRWNHLHNDKLFSNTTLTYSRYNFVTEVSYKDEIKDADSTHISFFGAKYVSGIEDAAAKIDFDYVPNPKHYIRFGANATFHTFKPGATNLKSQEDVQLTNVTFGNKNVLAGEFYVYGEDDLRVGDKFGANIGVHASGFAVGNKFYYSVQPRASLRYMLPHKIAVKGSFATMTQYIHLLTNEGIGLPTDLWVPSTQSIKPEQSWQAALGFAKTFAKMYEVSIEGYYRDMSNLLSYKPGASFLDVGSNNAWENKVEGTGKGQSYGAEFFLQKKQGKLTGWVSYTLAWNWRQFKGTDINFGEKYPFKYDRRHNVSIAATYEFTKRISASAVWVYGTGNAVTLPVERYLVPTDYGTTEVEAIGAKNSFRMRAYHRLDVSIDIKKEYKKWTSKWSFGVYNLYNRQNPFFIFSQRDFATGQRQFKQASLFPIIPSIRWDFKF